MSEATPPPLPAEDSELPTLEQALPKPSKRGEITSDAALETLGALQTFSYRGSEGGPRLGLRFRGVPHTNLAKGERYAPMDLLIVLTRVVQEQQQHIERLQKSLEGFRRAATPDQESNSSGSSST
ncbi:MAG: hypothetical protein AAGA81_07800 [Acidobacteriota bacterium]